MSRFLFVLSRRGNAKSLRQRLIDRTRQRRHVRKAGDVDQPLFVDQRCLQLPFSGGVSASRSCIAGLPTMFRIHQPFCAIVAPINFYE